MSQNHKCNNLSSHGNRAQDKTNNKETHNNNRSSLKTGKKSDEDAEDPP
jgi:hypothetical protein